MYTVINTIKLGEMFCSPGVSGLQNDFLGVCTLPKGHPVLVISLLLKGTLMVCRLS